MIRVSLSEFFQRRSWFQIYWLDLGLPLETSQAFVAAIQSVDKATALFEDLSPKTYPDVTSTREEIDRLKLKRPLTEHQIRNIASLLRAPNGSNFSVPGAGKTATQLVTWKILADQGDINRMLVVCPKSSFEAWQAEPQLIFEDFPRIEVFAGQLVPAGTRVLVVNFEKLENASLLDALLQWLRQDTKSSLVVDEAHRVKGGPAGVRWRACRKLAGASKRVDLLTGTPMPQSFEDLRNLLGISWPAIPKGYLDDARLLKVKPGGIFTRTTKAELELPPIDVQRIPIEMGTYQAEIYKALCRNFSSSLNISNKDMLTLMKKGRAVMCVLMAATNPALLNKISNDELLKTLNWPPAELESQEMMSALQSYLTHEIPPKFEWVARYLERARVEGRKVLVWSSFVGNLEALGLYLAKYAPAVIHGGISSEDRAARLDRFRNDPTCFALLTNPQTLGEGISLHKTAHEAVFLDRTFNAAQYLQALDRIHRLGLPPTQKTTVYLLESQGSIDERVAVRLEDKIRTLATLLDDEGLVQISLGEEMTDGWYESLGFDLVDLENVFEHLVATK
jgi:SNF2 family DNA or RNA helicase